MPGQAKVQRGHRRWQLCACLLAGCNFPGGIVGCWAGWGRGQAPHSLRNGSPAVAWWAPRALHSRSQGSKGSRAQTCFGSILDLTSAFQEALLGVPFLSGSLDPLLPSLQIPVSVPSSQGRSLFRAPHPLETGRPYLIWLQTGRAWPGCRISRILGMQ